MTREEFSKLTLDEQFALINEYAKEVFREGEECAGDYEYGRPYDQDPTRFEVYIKYYDGNLSEK